MKESFWDRVISRLDRLDAGSIQSYIHRLTREKGFLETVFNSIKEGIIVIDSLLTPRYANNAAIEMLGMPENYQERRISRYLRDIDWKGVFSGNDDSWFRVSSGEIEVFYPQHRVLGFYLAPHEGRKDFATLILNDITESRKIEADNFESRKIELISTLAAGVAHEIGNPLNSLNIHLQLLDRHFKENPDAEARELLDIARSEVARLDLIISQFLRAIRPSKPEMVDVDPRRLLAETVAFIRGEVEARDIAIKETFPENVVPTILGDPNQLKQALYNLIKNAIQAMAEGGELGIGVEVDDKYVSISVSDTGEGVPVELMGDIFKPYFSAKPNGTGLGLMVVERVAREHGAVLDVKTSPGKGAVFVLRFPRKFVRTRLLSPPASERDDDMIDIPTYENKETNPHENAQDDSGNPSLRESP